MRRCLKFRHCFSASMEIWLLMGSVILIGSLILHQLYIAGINSIFYVLFVSFANIFLWIFIPLLMRDFDFIIFFSYDVFVWLWYQSNAGLIKWAWKYSLILHFLKELVQNLYYFFLYYLKEFTRKTIWGWGLVYEKLFNYKFNLMNIGFQFSISCVSIL